MKKATYMNKDSEISSITPLAFDDTGGNAPEEFLLIRYGANNYTKGDKDSTFQFSEADADSIIADFEKRGKDLVCDYEHQTISGGIAPASGWIRELVKCDDGLKAKVEWTEKAQKMLTEREYRYHSPVIHFSGERACKLHSVALTNHPALHCYPALVASDTETKKENKMNEALKKIACLLGVEIVALADGAEDEAKTVEAIESKINTFNELLSLHDCKTPEELTLKIAGMVPASVQAELEARLAKIEANKAVEKAFTDGKLIEAQREWAQALAEKDLKAFNDYAEKAPKVAPGSASIVETGTPPKVDEVVTMTDGDLRIFNRLGLSEEQIKKIKDEKETKKEC